MQLRIMKTDENAVLPNFAHKDDAGMDLRSLKDVTIPSGEQVIISTGIAMTLPKGTVGLVWDKSGVSAKKQLKVMGGVVDEGYRGEIFVTLHNLGSKDQSFEAGDKVAQMLIQKVEHPEIIEVDTLEDSERGDGAFGSTGAK